MEMTLTVHVPRRRSRPVDVVVEWHGVATAAGLCAALCEHLDVPVPGLSARGRPVPPDTLVGMPPLLHGAAVAVDPLAEGRTARPAEPAGEAASGGVLDLVVVGGPDAGRSHPLTPPGLDVGRSPATGLAIADPALSRSHVFVGVAPGGITVTDRGSTNGVVVDGVRAEGATTTVDARSTVVVGSSTLRVRRASGPGPPVTFPGDGTVHVARAPAPRPVTADLEIACPPSPPERARARVPWIAAVAPVPVAVGLALFLGPQLLLFAALGPVSLIASALGDRLGSGRAHRRAVAQHAGAMALARSRLGDALRSERERLDRAHPDPASVLATAERRHAGLWRGSGTRVRLGLGDVPTRVAWVETGGRSRPLAERAPLVVDVGELGCVGILGPVGTTDGALAGLLGQLCVANPPHELSVSVTSDEPAWSWVDRLPHAAARGSPSAGAQGAAGARHVLVVPRPVPGISDVVGAALDAGAIVLVGAQDRAELPGGCRVVARSVDGTYVLEGPDEQVAFVPDAVGAWWTDRLSRALAPLRCTGGVGDGPLPSQLTLADALGGVDLSAGWVAEHWRTRVETSAHAGVATTPVAVVGAGRDGPMVVDLCRDGPHVLVGGTTGSGKSEFLRTLVTSLAVSSPPDDLTFVLVDFKGGAAFGPCAGLPHVVGLVTDLDDHLVSRALASLRAELRRREHLFAEVGASDLASYQRLRADRSEPVPRLVVVVDELRALVDELPDFVTGLVRLAALGRSLGVHLVLATQRPSGAVSAEIQANVSLRIAFRVRDRADSVDIIDDGSAASIAPGTPGRALARGADGVLVSFQAAMVAAPAAQVGPTLLVRRPGPPGKPSPRSGPPEVAVAQAVAGVVAAVRGAHHLSGGSSPRRPWLAPLPDLVRLFAGTASSAVTYGTAGRPASTPGGWVVGLVDEPDLQRVSPLAWDASHGSWLLAGGSATGRTTALRSLVLGAVARSGPRDLHVHVVDAHGSLSDLGALPHLGTRTEPEDPRGCAELVRHLRGEVDRRLAAVAEGVEGAAHQWPTTVVVVDGWEQLIEAQPLHAPDDLPGRLVRLLRDGRSVGLVGIVSGGRGLLHPRWSGVGGRTFLLGDVDPLDAALAGLRAGDVPRDPPAGRAVRVVDKREVQFARSTPDDSSSVAAAAGPRPSTGAAWRRRTLPVLVRRGEVRSGGWAASTQLDERGSPLLLGLGGSTSEPLHWRPDVDGRRLLVVGPPRSGRTNALRVIGESSCATGQPAAIISSAAVSDRIPWPAAAVVVAPHEPDLLVRLRRAHPDLAVLVDDVELLDESPVLPVLREIAGLVDRDRGLIVVATTSQGLSGRFRGLDVEVARHGCGLLLSPAGNDGAALGAAVPHGVPRLPGRGVLVVRGEPTEVQVLLSEPSVGQVAPREHLPVGVAGHPRRPDRHQCDHDDDPSLEHPGALDQADADRQQDDVPDDGGAARPRGGPEPTAGQGGQPEAAHQDQQRRHEHPRGVAALTQDQLDHVVDREPDEGQRLQAGEQRGEAAGAA